MEASTKKDRIIARVKESGVLGIAAFSAAFLKFVFFYAEMGIKANLLPIALFSFIILCLFFAAFKNKWIPIALNAAFSVLMFCDLLYNSFFSGYLSLAMIGSAEVVDNIGGSIWQQLRPEFLLVFSDTLLFVCDRIYRLIKKKVSNAEGSFVKYKLASALAIAVLFSLVILNPFKSDFLRSLAGQEFFCCHINDIGSHFGLWGNNDKGSLSAFKDSYKKEKNGEYFGLAKGRNLIVIQLESFQNFPIGMKYNGRDVTPNLNALISKDSLYFDNFYQQTGMGNTSDAEFAINNSYYGSLLSYTYKLYEDNYFKGLPFLLSEKGYKSAVFHAYEDRSFWNREKIYPKLGFDRFYGGLKSADDPEGYFEQDVDSEPAEWIGWGISDKLFFEQSAKAIDEELSEEPYYAFLISLSNHHPFSIPEKLNVLELLPEDEGSLLGGYLQGVSYTDYALGCFIEELKSRGLYENTVIAIYGDHMGLPSSEETDRRFRELMGYDYDIDSMLSIPLIINIPGSGVSETFHAAGGQIDFLPTIASLLGFNSLDTVYLGHNLLTAEEGFSALQTYVTRGSFASGSTLFEMSKDGIFEHSRAWSIDTHEPLPIEGLRELYEGSLEIVECSDYILKSDALRSIYLEGKGIAGSGDDSVSREAADAIYPAGYPDKEEIGRNDIDSLLLTISELEDESYCLRIEADYYTDGLPIFVDSDTRKYSLYATKLFPLLKIKEDVDIVINISEEPDWYMQYIRNLDEDFLKRFIPEIGSFEEYSGRYESIVNLDRALEGGMAPESLPELIEAKKPWGLSAKGEEARAALSALDPELLKNTNVYICDSEGVYRKQDPR